jgi:O-antigen/teichoic acid export membrane protein
VLGYLKRLAASSAAYQAASFLSATLAIVTLPLYTRYLTRAQYGYAETLLTFILLASIVLKFGIGEALLRFWFDDADPERRNRLAKTASGFIFTTTTIVALIALAFAGPLSQAILVKEDATLMALAILGLWAFTNLDVMYTLLRCEERRRAYMTASITNVVLTVTATVVLVVVFGTGARGYLLGNYGATTVVLLGMWVYERRRIAFWPFGGRKALDPLMKFGAPTVPADAAVFALNVVDRAYVLRAVSPGAAGLYALSVKMATIVILAVRGFQAAWPPLAYSVTDEGEAARLYAFVTTAYVLVTGIVVAAIVLLGDWGVRLLAAPSFYGATASLPWVALGWSLYGLFLVFVTIAGRAKITTRLFPAAMIGLAANAILLVTLVGPLGIKGAGIALCGAYVVMLIAIHLLTRSLFVVPFEWGRITLAVVVMGGVSVAGDLLLPNHGFVGFVTRTLALAAIPAILYAAHFLHPHELERLRAMARRRRPAASA